MEQKVLELVVFKLAEGVTDDAFLQTTGPASDWVKTQPGFISRELSRSPDGEKWIEVVWWETLESAEAAAAAAMSSSACSPIFSLIDFENTLMLHGIAAIPRMAVHQTPA